MRWDPAFGQPSVLLGPDLEQWAVWQRPHWSQWPVPGGRVELLVIDGLAWLVGLTLFFAVLSALLGYFG